MVLFHHFLPAGTEENNEKPSSGYAFIIRNQIKMYKWRNK